MASIQFNRLHIGSYSLDSRQMAPVHKRRLESCLSRIFPHPEGAIRFQLNNREISLEKFKDLGRIVRFYQHTGHLPRGGMPPQEEIFRRKVTEKTVRAMNEASIPGTNGHVLAGMRITEDMLSLIRNIIFSLPGFGADDPVANHLGYYAGMFWTFFAFRELDDGWREYQRSQAIQDAEGRRRAGARLLSGGICSTASLTYLTGRICSTFSATTAAAAALGAANLLFGAGSLLAMGCSLLGVLRCSRFNDRLNEYLEHPQLTEVQKFRGALQFLKDAISVTPEEKANLVERIEREHPDWSRGQKEEWLQQKIADLTEVKVKYLKRRTSNQSLFLILTQADVLLAKLADPKTQAEGICEAAKMLRAIQNENKIKMALYVLGFIAALISFSAMLTLTFLTAGALPFILYGISGGIYLGLALYSAAYQLLKKDPDPRRVDLHPILLAGGPHISQV